MPIRKNKHFAPARWGLIAAALAIGGLLASSPAMAAKTGSVPEYPVGITMGTPTGALPPDGLYLIVKPNYSRGRTVNANGDYTGTTSTVWSTNAQLMWVPGVKVLGARYAAFVRNIGVVNTTLKTPTGMTLHNSAKPDTEIIPLNLSWKLSQHLHFDAELGIYLNDGAYENKPGHVNIGQNEHTIEPNFSLAYLSDDWTLNGHLVFDINGTNDNAGFVNGERVSYRNGNTVAFDYTVFRKSRGFSYGLVGYWLSQFTDDHGPAQLDGGKPKQFAAGLGFQYHTGNLNLVTTYTHDLYARNVGKKNMLLFQLSFKLL